MINARNLGTIRYPTRWWYPYIKNTDIEDYEGQALLSFVYDDGYIDNYTTALFLHEKYKVPLTLFIIGNRMDWTRKYAIKWEYMHIEECKDSFRRNADIQSHTYSHPDLTMLSESEIEYEFSESKKRLEEEIPGTEVVTLAVPGSDYDTSTRDIVANLNGGYEGVRVHGTKQNNIPPEDIWWLNSKIAIQPSTTYDDMVSAIDDAIKKNKWCVLMWHRIIDDPDGFNATPEQLENILQYVAELNKKDILVEDFKTALRMSLLQQ